MRRFNVLVISLFVCCTAAIGQVATVHTTGLNTPQKIIKAPDNGLIVAEAGTTTANTGRLSIVDRTSGARHTLVSGLPSGLNLLGGNPAGDPSGPSGLKLRGNRLLITIANGDSVLPGGGPGLETPNATPSSPIFNSVLELTLPGGFALLDSPFILTLANQMTLDAGDPVTLTNAEGVSLTIRLVVDLPDWRPNPTPTVPGNVKASNLFGIDTFQRSAYVVDAGHNELKEVNLETGAWSTFVVFPPRPNPTMMGPPMIEAVPTNIHRFGNRFLVPLLTGFPFVANLAEVRRVNIKGEEHEQFIGSLTSAMDIAKVEEEEEEPAVPPGKYDEKEGAIVIGEPCSPVMKGTVSDDSSKLVTADDFPTLVTGALSDDLLKGALSDGATFAPGDGNAFYTLEFSTNMLGGAPGRLRFYQEPDAMPVNLLTNLITPTSMTLDGETGNLFITNIGPGTVTKVTFP